MRKKARPESKPGVVEGGAPALVVDVITSGAVEYGASEDVDGIVNRIVSSLYVHCWSLMLAVGRQVWSRKKTRWGRGVDASTD